MEVKVNIQGLSLSSPFELTSTKVAPRIHGASIHFDTERMSCSLIKTCDNNVHSFFGSSEFLSPTNFIIQQLEDHLMSYRVKTLVTKYQSQTVPS